MEPEVSLPCSEGPATGPYSELLASSAHLFTLYVLRSILILSSHLRLGLPSDLFLSDFATEILYAFVISPMRATYLTHLIRLDFITLRILGEAYNL